MELEAKILQLDLSRDSEIPLKIPVYGSRSRSAPKFVCCWWDITSWKNVIRICLRVISKVYAEFFLFLAKIGKVVKKFLQKFLDADQDPDNSRNLMVTFFSKRTSSSWVRKKITKLLSVVFWEVANWQTYKRRVKHNLLGGGSDIFRMYQGAPSFSTLIFHDFSLTLKKWKSITYRHNIYCQVNNIRLMDAYQN